MFNSKKVAKGILVVILLVGLMVVFAGCAKKDTSDSSGELRYPIKAINAISPWTAGGGSDTAFRGYLKYIADELGQNINVQNLTGGNGAIGWAAAAAAPADGYNMALLTFDILTNQAQRLSPTSYKDFEVINMFTIQGMVLMTHRDFGWTNLEQFLDAAKKARAEGRTLKIGVAGEAGLWHQAGVVMAEGTDTEGAYTFVPFQGSSDQLADMLGKHLDAIVTSLTASIGHVQQGTLVTLAAMTDERIEVIPNVPTFKELGYNVKYESWRALVVPKGTPAPIVERLREAGHKAFFNPDFQKWAHEANIDPFYKDHKETLEHMENQYPFVEGVMKKFGLI